LTNNGVIGGQSKKIYILWATLTDASGVLVKEIKKVSLNWI
jgi:hypothetical protein